MKTTWPLPVWWGIFMPFSQTKESVRHTLRKSVSKRISCIRLNSVINIGSSSALRHLPWLILNLVQKGAAVQLLSLEGTTGAPNRRLVKPSCSRHRRSGPEAEGRLLQGQEVGHWMTVKTKLDDVICPAPKISGQGQGKKGKQLPKSNRLM